MSVSGTRASIVLASLAALALGGCGEVDPPPGRIDVLLTFHRDEAPVRVTRSVEIPPGTEADASQAAEELLAAALEALVEGPRPDEREAGIGSFFSDATSGILRSVEIEDGRAVVDFGDFRSIIPNASSSAGSLALLTELNGTVFGNVPLDEVEYRLEGSCQAFWGFLQRDCTRVTRPASARDGGPPPAPAVGPRGNARPGAPVLPTPAP